MTLNDLRDLVIFYSKRTDLRVDNNLDKIIDLVAVKIGQDVHLSELDRIATLVVNEKVGLPDGYMRMRSVTMSRGGRTSSLISVSSDQFAQPRTMVEVYTIKNGQIHINGSAELTINYSIRPEKLVSDLDTNFVLTNVPTLYLYGTLMEVWSSVQDAEAFAHAQVQYNDAVNKSNISYERQTFGSNTRISRVDL